MKNLFRTSLLAATIPFITAHAIEDPVGYWDFEDLSDPNAAEIGADLSFTGSQFTVNTAHPIDAAGVRVLSGSHYTASHGISGNGGGNLVNEYSILMDVSIASIGWSSLLETDGAGDGDFFVNPSLGIGIMGDYYGAIASGYPDFSRLVISVDLGSATPITTYLDGELVHAHTPAELTGDGGDGGVIDGRWALRGTFDIGNDGSGASEEEEFWMTNLALYDTALTSSQVAELGVARSHVVVPEPGYLAVLGFGVLIAVARRKLFG